MLEVTDILKVARGQSTAAGVRGQAAGRYAPRSASRAPVIVWNICRDCNLTCPHCYAAASAQPSPLDLSTEQGIALLDQLAAAGVKILIVSGGEPLLRPDVFTLLAHAKSVGISAQLSTNGVLIDRNVAEKLAGLGVRYVGISIDGMPEFNDEYRGMEGGFELASRGLVEAKRAGIRTGLRITLTTRNQDQLEPLLDHAVSLGVDRFYVSHLVYSGRGLKIAGDDLTPEQARCTLHRLFERADRMLSEERTTTIVTGGNDSDGPALALWVEEHYGPAAAARVREILLRRGGNSAGESILSIDHRGRVHPDQFWSKVSLGDVRQEPLSQIFAHPLREELRDRDHRLTGRCGGCAFLPMCRGSHRERALARYSDMWAPDPACVLTESEIGVSAPVPASDREVRAGGLS